MQGTRAAFCSLAITLACRHVRGLHTESSHHRHSAGHRQLLQTGRPYDFDDADRDIVAKEVVVESNSQIFRTGAADKVRFFRESGCDVFSSAELCAHARAYVTYLASYPCSGNTWMRSMLEQSLLIYTGSIYYDPELWDMGFHGENITDPSLVFPLKTHWPVSGHHAFGEGIRNLLIMREPLHAVVSILNLLRTDSHSQELPKEELRQAFDNRGQEMLEGWATMAWAYKGREDVRVVRYEDVKVNPKLAYMRDVFPYLGVNASNPAVKARFGRAIERCDKAFNTSRRKHTYAFEFTANDKELARRTVGADLAAYYGYQL